MSPPSACLGPSGDSVFVWGIADFGPTIYGEARPQVIHGSTYCARCSSQDLYPSAGAARTEMPPLGRVGGCLNNRFILSVLEAGRPNSRCWLGGSFWRFRRRICSRHFSWFLLVVGSSWCFWACGNTLLSSLPPSSRGHLFSVTFTSPSLYKNWWYRVGVYLSGSIRSPAKTLSPSKLTFMGTRVRTSVYLWGDTFQP